MILLYLLMVSFRVAMSYATLSRVVPLPSPPPENSKLGVLLVAVNVTLSFLCLLRDLVILPGAGGGCEPCCGANDAVHSEPLGSPSGS
jgi:hypothetical protein